MLKHKMLIGDFKLIKSINYKKIELAGICLNDNRKSFNFLDFTGEIEIFKKENFFIPKKRCIIFCNIFYKANNLSLFCTGYKLADIYETIFFTIESIKLHK